jgi:hypothetical protein
MIPAEADAHRVRMLTEFYHNRRLAHEVIFKHRHPIRTPAFHHEIQDIYHSAHPQVVIEGFRDAAKSTVAEEAIVLGALFEEFKNAVVIGASYTRAVERLIAIRNEFVVNEAINQLFGTMEGDTWTDGKIVLKNDVCIQAAGAGSSLRGMRHNDARPDFVLIDDLEDEESVKTPEQREKMLHWLYRTLLPACAKGPAGQIAYRVRFMGNRLDRDAVIVRVSKDTAWLARRYPVMVQDEEGTERFDLPAGRWRPLWGAKFSLDDIAKKRQEYERLGLLHDFNCEYMCEADDPEARIFKEGDAKTKATVRTWQSVYAAYDPARTVGTASAMTGVAVFSWIGARLVVWRGDAQLWLPDQICDDIFATDDAWQPTEIGVEATGLEEFIMQPLRHRSLQRRQLLPLRRLVPPRGKDSFIRGLQPFFKSGQVDFVDVSHEARGQLLSFPTGRKDFPNALAYALMMKPGLPVYDISREHILETLIRQPNQPWWLAVNATNQYTTAALLQVIDGQIRVHADWVREGPPGEVLGDIVGQAQLDAGVGGGALRVMVKSVSATDVVGLRIAARALRIEPRSGSEPARGRERIRDLLTRRKRDQPLFVVAHASRWVLNGLAGGYAYSVGKRGELSDEPEEGSYRVLMEGLESFVAVMDIADREDEAPRRAVGLDGREYTTILATAAPPAPSKDEWHRPDVINSARTLRRG